MDINDTHVVQIRERLNPDLEAFVERLKAQDSSIPIDVVVDTVQMLTKRKAEFTQGLDDVDAFTADTYMNNPTPEGQEACMEKMRLLSADFPEFIIGVFGLSKDPTQESYATYYYRGEVESTKSKNKDDLYNTDLINIVHKHQFALPKIKS